MASVLIMTHTHHVHTVQLQEVIKHKFHYALCGMIHTRINSRLKVSRYMCVTLHLWCNMIPYRPAGSESPPLL